MEPLVGKITERLHIRRDCLPYRCLQMSRTAILVCIGELFFRAHGLRAGLAMFKKIVTEFTFTTVRNRALFTFGMDKYDYYIVVFAVLIIFLIGIIQEMKIPVRTAIARRNIVVRFVIYYALILFIVIFGAYGAGYVPVDPIYAGF